MTLLPCLLFWVTVPWHAPVCQQIEPTAVLHPHPIIIQNLAPHARDEWFSAIVPFQPGAVFAPPSFHVDGCVTVWQQFGATHQDGSWRQALCLFRTQMRPLAEHALPLVAGKGPLLDTKSRGAQAEQNPSTQPAPPFQLTFAARIGGRTFAAHPRFQEVLESNDARDVALFLTRIPETGLVCEVLVERYAGQEHMWCDIAVFFSDPTTPSMQCQIESLTVHCEGMAFLPRHAARLGIKIENGATGNQVQLLAETVLGDGQGIRRAGVLVPALRGDRSLRDSTLAAAALIPPLAATSWREREAFGPFGHVPDPPPWLHGPGLRAALARRHAEFVRQDRPPGDPFQVGRHGLAKNAGQSGDQADFGVVKASVVAWSGLPSFLHELELSVLQEALRPVHFFETDGTPVEPADHPDWIVWSGRTHWHGGVSKDRLGKPVPEPRFEAHGWTGKDREHWSSNSLGAFAQLTGRHFARRQLENESRLFLAGQTTDPRHSTSGPGAPRGAGRVLQAACWIWLATGDEELLARMLERLERVYHPCWIGRELPPTRMRPFLVMGKDGRQLDGETPWWAPWQDALAVIGFAAAHRISGDTHALELAEGLALNLLRFGWKLEGAGAPIIATAIRWQDQGVPPTPEQLILSDKSIVVWSHGTAFSLWALPSVEVGRQAAERIGDADLVARAEAIQAALRRNRQRPSDGFLDPLTEWDALR